MVSGIITSIKHNRSKTATKIRINSRTWGFIKEVLPLDFFGGNFQFTGTWKESKATGKYLAIDSYKQTGFPDREKVFEQIKKSANPFVDFLGYENLLYPLWIMGKKALVLKYLKWRIDKKNRYLSNPYLFYIKKELDFESTELLAYLSVPTLDNLARLHAVCMYILDAEYKNGREALALDELTQKSAEYFNNEITALFPELFRQRGLNITLDNNLVFLNWIYFVRRKSLQIMNFNHTTEHYTEMTDEENLKTLIRNRFSILSGGAGTGKTTLLRKLAQMKLNVTYAATTGKAAKLLGSDAVTIHSLLGYGRKGFAVKKLDCDILVVDEASMLDWQTLYAIVAAAPRVIFAGDPKQLPPIHGEPVFIKMLEILPTVTLTQNWRFKNNQTSNVEVIRRPDADSIINTAKTLVKIFSLKNETFQLLSPIKGNNLGTNNLNSAIQKLLNPKNSVVTKTGIRQNDKVIITRNVYVDGVMLASNGTIGHIVDTKANFIGVKIDKNIVYVREQDIELAYALTVHKAQGSEFDYVVFLVPQMQKEFLTDELMFVGQTRGRKKTYMLTL